MKTVSVENAFYGSPVYYVEETTSTMVLARRLTAESGNGKSCASGTVVWAGYQSRGRGRVAGRVWESGFGENLTFTLILGESVVSGNSLPVPLVTGLGLAFFLEDSFGLKPEIKWPNDLMLEGRKISGILVEHTKNCYLVGIGINVNQLAFSKEIESRTTSLRRETGRLHDLNTVLSGILRSLEKAFHSMGQKESIEKRLYRRNERIVFLPGDPSLGTGIEAVLTGLGEDGTLVLKDAAGKPVTASSGEIVY